MDILRATFRMFATALLFISGSASSLEAASQAEEAGTASAVFNSIVAYSHTPDAAGVAGHDQACIPPGATRQTYSPVHVIAQPFGRLHHITQSPRAPPVYC